MTMIDEGELRRRFPAIPWDQPVKVVVPPDYDGWACRYCIALYGLRASELLVGVQRAGVYSERNLALDHIEAAHHD